MSRVMRVDNTIFCVAAHQDNAYPAASPHAGPFPVTSKQHTNRTRLDPMQFEFRRGNHFMAPGFMISKSQYTKFIQFVTSCIFYSNLF